MGAHGSSTAPGSAGATSSEGALSVLFAWTRFWVAMLWTCVATVLAASGGALGMLMPRETARRWQGLCAVFWAGTILWVARCPVETTFLPGERPTRGFIYASNHSSILDILALFLSLRGTPFVFAAKKELFKIPFIGWHLRWAGFVEVDRQHRDRALQSYAKAAAQVREGTVVTLYPEGTRSLDGTVLPFKKGPFMLAIEAQAPIVPVATDGAQHALRKHSLRLYGHPIRVVVGPQIETRGLVAEDRDELLRRVRVAILQQHLQAGGGPSPLEPMIAPPGKQSGERP